MEEERIHSLRFWMNSKNIRVPANWIQACVEWLEETNERSITNHEELKKHTYEQWLLTDLKDFDQRVLPEEVKNEKYLLKGAYCLQIDHVIDVSQPKQSQLNHLLNKHNENNLVCTETQATQKPWEAKPTRMLNISLTDGVISVTGMEYRPIMQLSTKIIPGTKICIKGPINCRCGVLFLEQKNVEVLGGEVEAMIETNSYAAVLSRGLGLPIDVTALARTENRETDISDQELASILFTDIESEDRDEVPMQSPERIELGSVQEDTWAGDVEDDFDDDELAMLLMDAEDKGNVTPNDDRSNQSNNYTTDLPKCLLGAKCLLLDEQNSHTKITLNIKVIIITLLSSLKSDIERGWSLKSRICDGTDVLDVEFSNRVLEKLIGLTVTEADALKKDSQSKILLKDRLNKCRQLIITFCHFMTVEVADHGHGQLTGVVMDVDI